MMIVTLFVAYAVSQMLEWIFRDWFTVMMFSAYLIAELRMMCADEDDDKSKAKPRAKAQALATYK